MNRIREIRKQMGLSQLELANQLNVNQTAVSQWERGATLPSASVLLKLASILDTSSDYLLGISDDPKCLIYEDNEIMDEVLNGIFTLSTNIINETSNSDPCIQKEIFDIFVELDSILNSNCDKKTALSLIKDNIVSVNRTFNKK